jgi:hypothetical protein
MADMGLWAKRVAAGELGAPKLEFVRGFVGFTSPASGRWVGDRFYWLDANGREMVEWRLPAGFNGLKLI